MPDKKGRLSPKERRFVTEMARVGDPTYAATRAGYLAPQQSGSYNMQNPVIEAAVRQRQQVLLHGELRDDALNVLGTVMRDPKASSRDKISAAKVVLDKTDKAPEEASAKGLSEMSVEEIDLALARANAVLEAAMRRPLVIDETVDDVETEPAAPPRLPDPLPTETSVFG